MCIPDAFLNIHGLQKSRLKSRAVGKQMSSLINTSPLDKRGQHDTRKNKFSEEQINLVLKHINKIPIYKSHYSQKDNHDKFYIGHEYSIIMIYEDYKQKFYKEINTEPVSLDKYIKIYISYTKYSFQTPKIRHLCTC